MAKHTVKCRYCKKEVNKEDAYVEEGTFNYYCSLFCQNSAKQKRLKKEQRNYKSIKGTDRRIATDYIQQLYINKGIDEVRIPWDMIGAQMKNMLDEHRDWNYTTLYYVMWYMTDILGMDLLSDRANTPLSLIPYYVIEAKDYWAECQRINELANAFEIPDKTIRTGTPKPQKKKFKKITF